MNQEKRRQFNLIIERVAGIPRPRFDYSKLSNSSFASYQFRQRLMEIQAFFMALYRATGKFPISKKGMEYVLVASMKFTPSELAEIYDAYPDGRLVYLLADLKIEELFIAAELGRRLADKRIGTVLILDPFFTGTQPSEGWLTKELKVDKIKAYRDYIQDENDIRQDSITRAFELVADLLSNPYDPGLLPEFPLEMQPHEASLWNVGLAKVWKRGHETLRKGLIPVLQGDAENIPEKVKTTGGKNGERLPREKRFTTTIRTTLKTQSILNRSNKQRPLPMYQQVCLRFSRKPNATNVGARRQS